jgi:hypothetical protein
VPFSCLQCSTPFERVKGTDVLAYARARTRTEQSLREEASENVSGE